MHDPHPSTRSRVQSFDTGLDRRPELNTWGVRFLLRRKIFVVVVLFHFLLLLTPFLSFFLLLCLWYKLSVSGFINDGPGYVCYKRLRTLLQDLILIYILSWWDFFLILVRSHPLEPWLTDETSCFDCKKFLLLY